MVMVKPEGTLLDQPKTPDGDRFEFRIFGASLKSVASMLRAIAGAGRFEAAVDRYIVVPNHHDIGLKLTDKAIEIKILQEVVGGLERWHPSGRVALPLRGSDFDMLDLGLPRPPAEFTFGDASDLAGWLVHQGVHVISLRKRRRRFLLESALAELGEVTGGACRLKTLAVESVDPQAVASLVVRLGLTADANTSYPRLVADLPMEGSAQRPFSWRPLSKLWQRSDSSTICDVRRKFRACHRRSVTGGY
jgi:hypothetical protein